MNQQPQLKSSVAFQSGTDINKIPISRDGIAVCENCEVKYAFYTRERKFCSLLCTRFGDKNYKYQKNISKELKSVLYHLRKNNKMAALPPLSSSTESNSSVDDGILKNTSPCNITKQVLEISRSYTNTSSFDWKDLLKNPLFETPSVSSFYYAPMTEIWENVITGIKVEVRNEEPAPVIETFTDCFWVATVQKVMGYKVLLRYEGFGHDNSHDFWLHLCVDPVYPVGWCASQGKPLIPPKGKYKDWKEFLKKRLMGACTLPSDFEDQVCASLQSKFNRGDIVEVVDKFCISQMRQAQIVDIIGRRLQLTYLGLPKDSQNEFYCHEESSLIHSLGWAKQVGHHIVTECPDEISHSNPKYQHVNKSVTMTSGFEKGMKLEAIDPLNLSSICVATITRVLADGYLMVQIDTPNQIDNEKDAEGHNDFCYHITSPYIFPAGFCQKNSIPLISPTFKSFSWETYLEKEQATAVPPTAFHPPVIDHGFCVGQKLEAVDLMDPKLVCVATVCRVVGHLLKVHFDGWDDEFDQWINCQSPDIYPIGWCQLVGHRLEGPPPLLSGITPKRKTRSSSMKRRKKIKFKKNVINKQSVNVESEIVNGCATESGLPMPLLSSHNSTKSEQDNLFQYIPCLLDFAHSRFPHYICPNNWSVNEVVYFLKINDCANYCDKFFKTQVNGQKLLDLSKEELLVLTGMKVGPSLKIYDLIQKLKAKINPSLYRQNKQYARSQI